MKSNLSMLYKEKKNISLLIRGLTYQKTIIVKIIREK